MSILRYQRSLAEDGQENSHVECRSPEPVSGVEPGGLLEVSPEEDDRKAKEYLPQNESTSMRETR